MQRANSTVRCRLAFFCLFSAVIGLGATTSAKAQSPETVDCKNEGMEVADASMIKAACYKRDITGARVRETLTQLEGQLLGAFIIVRRLKAGFRTYIQGQSAQEWLSQDSTFSHIEGYSWHQTVLGFETGTYHGTVPEAGPSVLSCFTFLHNEGSPRETEGASGSLVVVQGFYCKAFPSDLSDSEIGTVVNEIHVRTD